MYAFNRPVVNIHYTRTDTLPFYGPYPLKTVSLPAIAGVYTILTKNFAHQYLDVIYVGETANLAERGFPTNHHAYPRWVKEAAGRILQLAYLPAAVLNSAQRLQLESAIIQTYNPPANRTRGSFMQWY